MESRIFTALADIRLWTKHPFTITRVRPQPDGSVTIHLDAYAAAFDETYNAAERAFSCLAPFAEADGSSVTGIPGLSRILMEDASLQPLWDEPRVADDERRYMRSEASVHGHLDWLGSAPLRRARLFQSATNAFYLNR